MSSENRSFRVDINGLRAWAVLAVVLYHFSIPGFSGGFAGVDVFFVISGFLMTKIISDGIQVGRFSLWGFYFARACRIWPALIVLSVSLLALGWFILMPDEYQALGKHARDSLLFTSNLRYLKESGYFDMASSQKWLLHTWSLSIEWQFYLVFPILLVLLKKLRFGQRTLCAVLGIGLSVSLAWSVWLSLYHHDSAFFFLSSRIWEMLAGSLLLLISRDIKLTTGMSVAIAWLGFLLIVVAITSFNFQTVWPGGWALIPVVGTCFVMLARNEHSILVRLKALQWLGDRSYSVYLWHWPLVVGLGFLERQGDWWWVLSGVFLSLLLGDMSYRLIENPARQALHFKPRYISVVMLLVVFAGATASAQAVREKELLSERLPKEIAALVRETQDTPPRLDECTVNQTECFFGEGKVGAIIIGDSHAGALADVVQRSMPYESARLYFRARAGCLPVFGAFKLGGRDRTCDELQQWILLELPEVYPGRPVILINRTTAYVMGGMPGEPDQLQDKPEYIFSTSYESPEPQYLREFRDHYVETACAITKHHPLYIVRPLPEMKLNVPYAMARDLLLGRTRDLSLPLNDYYQRHKFIWSVQDEASERCGAVILNPLPYLCHASACPATEAGKPLYYDDDHLGVRGGKKLIPMFQKVFDTGK